MRLKLALFLVALAAWFLTAASPRAAGYARL
jgi:hypothetical protein